jgi:hypothetical protein
MTNAQRLMPILKKGGHFVDNLTKIIRAEITRQYRSVRQFSFAVNIPLSTINSALHNGVGGSSFDTVMQICRTLGIKTISDDAAFYLTDDTQRLLTQFSQLDDYGRHTVNSVLQVEFDRCTELSSPYGGKNAGFGGVNSVNLSAPSAQEEIETPDRAKNRRK